MPETSKMRTTLARFLAGVIGLWLTNTVMITAYLGMPLLLLFIVPVRPSRWDDWIPDGIGFKYWFPIYLLGLSSQLVHYIGWVCLRMRRGQRTDFLVYPFLSMRISQLLSLILDLVAEPYLYLTGIREEDYDRKNGSLQHKRWDPREKPVKTDDYDVEKRPEEEYV
ncbi:hypothetical protein F5Y01DRAFT_313100 [Xylaria sp. FL0043]|nr:hypothetical protein F5Y01DRAFT_313100 [Xylaria sp. FL0043]